MSATTKHTNCPICNSDQLSVMSKYHKDHLVKCENCGFVFSDIIPAYTDLIQYYSERYERTKYFSPITRKRYEELLDGFEKYRKTGKILDIGCGYGFFLEVAKEKGWEVYGCELSKDAVAECEKKGIKMHFGDISTSPFDPGTYDVIVSIEVIEHLIDPNPYLKSSFDLLRSGGIFYVTTPNFDSYLRYRLGPQYDVIDFPNHLGYYTKKTLRDVFERKGFKTDSVTATGMSVTRVKTSKGSSNQEYVSETSDDEMLRYRIEHNAFLRFSKNMTNGVLNLFKLGVSLKGVFQKP